MQLILNEIEQRVLQVYKYFSQEQGYYPGVLDCLKTIIKFFQFPSNLLKKSSRVLHKKFRHKNLIDLKIHSHKKLGLLLI